MDEVRLVHQRPQYQTREAVRRLPERAPARRLVRGGIDDDVHAGREGTIARVDVEAFEAEDGKIRLVAGLDERQGGGDREIGNAAARDEARCRGTG
ncbi:MAG: hypothetical protein JNK67_10535 [Alphaproteobacteria bacterium]|nr:hypothetical protein [Alphaproteobacteria bacterium]